MKEKNPNPNNEGFQGLSPRFDVIFHPIKQGRLGLHYIVAHPVVELIKAELKHPTERPHRFLIFDAIGEEFTSAKMDVKISISFEALKNYVIQINQEEQLSRDDFYPYPKYGVCIGDSYAKDY